MSQKRGVACCRQDLCGGPVCSVQAFAFKRELCVFARLLATG